MEVFRVSQKKPKRAVQPKEPSEEQFAEIPDQSSTTEDESLPPELLELREDLIEEKVEHDETGRPKLDHVFMKETLLYIAFLILFSVVVLAVNDEVTYVYINGFRQHLIQKTASFEVDPFQFNFDSIANKADFQTWLTKVFLVQMFPQPIAEYTRVIGAYRLRQIRVKSQNCDFPKSVVGEPSVCFPHYFYLVNEDRENFGKNGTYTWSSPEDLGGAQMIGSIGLYGNGGFYVDIPSNDLNNATKAINALKTNNFFDDATRALFLDFNLFNANLNQFLVVRLLVEFPSTGGAITRADIRAPYLYRYVTTVDYVVMTCELLILIFVVYYLAQELHELFLWDPAYWKKGWNYIDWANILCFIAVAAIRIATLLIVNETDFAVQGWEYVEMQHVAFLASQEANIMAFNGFIMWFKIIKYLRVFPRMNVLVNTLKTASRDIIAFIIMFFVVFVAFSQTFYMSMGRDNLSFSTFSNSMSTLVVAAFVEFDYSKMTSGNRILGPILFIVYMIIVVFIMANVFIAIVSDSYAHLRVQKNEADFRQELISFAKDSWNTVLTKIRIRKTRVMEINEILSAADTDNDGVISAEERAAMEAKNKDNQELMAVLQKADENQDGTIDTDELVRMHQEMNLELRKLNKKEMDVLNSARSASLSARSLETWEQRSSESAVLAAIMERFQRLEDNVSSANAKLAAVHRKQ